MDRDMSGVQLVFAEPAFREHELEWIFFAIDGLVELLEFPIGVRGVVGIRKMVFERSEGLRRRILLTLLFERLAQMVERFRGNGSIGIERHQFRHPRF